MPSGPHARPWAPWLSAASTSNRVGMVATCSTGATRQRASALLCCCSTVASAEGRPLCSSA
eukprot:11158225-Lingulodinium_polyedra.AAC.2